MGKFALLRKQGGIEKYRKTSIKINDCDLKKINDKCYPFIDLVHNMIFQYFQFPVLIDVL